MNRKRLISLPPHPGLCLGLALNFLFFSTVQAQNPLPANTQVYTAAQQMPQLPAGGGLPAILAVVQQQLVSPPHAVEDAIAGTTFVAFIVGPDGLIAHTYIARSLRPDCDSAAMAAVRRLPALLPARQNGRPVYATYTLPVRFSPAATH